MDCLICGPGVLIELDTSVTLQKVSLLCMALLFSVYNGHNHVVLFLTKRGHFCMMLY